MSKKAMKDVELELPTETKPVKRSACHACGSKCEAKHSFDKGAKFYQCPACGSYSALEGTGVEPEVIVENNTATVKLHQSTDAKQVLKSVYAELGSGGVCTVLGPFVNGRKSFDTAKDIEGTVTVLEQAGVAIAGKAVGFDVEVEVKYVKLTKL